MDHPFSLDKMKISAENSIFYWTIHVRNILCMHAFFRTNIMMCIFMELFSTDNIFDQLKVQSEQTSQLVAWK